MKYLKLFEAVSQDPGKAIGLEPRVIEFMTPEGRNFEGLTFLYYQQSKEYEVVIESDTILKTKSPAVMMGYIKLKNLEEVLTDDAYMWLEEEVMEGDFDSWDEIVQRFVKNGPLTKKDGEALGIDTHEYRGTISAKKYNA